MDTEIYIEMPVSWGGVPIPAYLRIFTQDVSVEDEPIKNPVWFSCIVKKPRWVADRNEAKK